MDVHHGHLIDDDHVRVQGILLVALKSHTCRGAALPLLIQPRPAGELQQPVNGPGLVARGLGHALGGAPGGGRQKDLHLPHLEVADDDVDRGGLAGAGAAGDD